MPIFHIALAVLVACIWGFNFVVAQIGLSDVSPLVLCCGRFFLASIPLAFFVKRPQISFAWLLGYGLINFFLQYSLLFIGMMVGMPAGLASLIYQTQIFFTLALAFIFFQEKPSRIQMIGLMVSLAGIFIVALNKGVGFSLTGFLLVLCAAAAWAVGNVFTKKIGKVNLLGLVVWGNLVSVPPMFILTFIVEGKEQILFSITNMADLSILAVFYIAYLSTLVAFSIWCMLLNRYPVSSVVPFTLLVPVVGLASSALVFDEPLHAWKLMAGGLILCGVAINVCAPLLLKKSL